MGRPRAEDKFKKQVIVQTLVTRAEEKRLVAMRKATGMSISAILRAGLITMLESYDEETKRLELPREDSAQG